MFVSLVLSFNGDTAYLLPSSAALLLSKHDNMDSD